MLSDFDLHLLGEGHHWKSYEKLGAQLQTVNGQAGVSFAVWAPNAQQVEVVGEFNAWSGSSCRMHRLVPGGIWELFIPGLGAGALYKYRVHADGSFSDRCDPYGFGAEVPPRTASVVIDLGAYQWRDGDWMAHRAAHNALDAPLNIYEVHLGSWKRPGDNPQRWLTYAELEQELVPYVVEMGFTHVEFLPPSEHPLSASWGYQTIGLFAATSRFGPPQAFMSLIDAFHRAGVGVLIDWVPAHFPRDGHGLRQFDGTALYEHEDPRKGEHPDWGTMIFNYGRNEVSNYLISSGLFWLDRYHVDGLRVDAVASMLYLDYSREPGDWIPNEHGGRENLEAIRFLRQLNAEIHNSFPGVITIAEESTAWPGVTRPVEAGGLGFDYKWDMGWMHDTLKHFPRDPIHRRHHQGELTFRSIYAFNENFVLPLSHDEVVHLKRSLLGKMWGDEWQRFACLRSLIAYQFTTPGKKLLFMGCEWGQTGEWNHDQSLDWHQLQWDKPRGMLEWTSDLARLYRNAEALHWGDCTLAGFEWITCDDATNGVLAWVRWNHDHKQAMVCVMGTTPVARLHYRMGFPWAGNWTEVLNSDAAHYGGSNIGNRGAITTHQGNHGIWAAHGEVAIPPLGFVIFEGRME